jgi:hypothetical protein
MSTQKTKKIFLLTMGWLMGAMTGLGGRGNGFVPQRHISVQIERICSIASDTRWFIVVITYLSSAFFMTFEPQLLDNQGAVPQGLHKTPSSPNASIGDPCFSWIPA